MVARLVDVARVVLTLVVGGRELLAERDVLLRTVVAGRELLGTATAAPAAPTPAETDTETDTLVTGGVDVDGTSDVELVDTDVELEADEPLSEVAACVSARRFASASSSP